MNENTLFDKQQVDQPVSQQPEAPQPEDASQPASVDGTPPPAIPTDGAGGSPQVSDHSMLKKIIIGVVVAIVLIILVVIFLPKAAIAKPVKLVWWGLWEDSKVMQPLINDFEREHPNISVEYVKQSPRQYRDRLVARANNGTGPDIFRYHNTWYPMLSDILLPLSSDVITQADFKKDFYPVMQTDLIHNGGIFGIPLGVDTLSMFVNTDLLSAAGTPPPDNWEDFLKTSRTLTVKDADGKIKTAGAALGTYGNITHAPDIIALLFVQQGVMMQQFLSSQTNQIDALDFYFSFAKGDQRVWDETLDESLLAFSKGNLAIYFGYSWDIFALQKLNSKLPFKTYPVPKLYNKTTTIASYWVEGVSAKSAHQKEALLFMHYLAQKETAQKLYTETAKVRSFGELYARTDLASSLKDNELIFPFVSQLGTATSSYFASDTHDGEGGLNFSANTYLGNAVNAVIKDSVSTETAVDTFDKGMSQVLLKYGLQ